MCDGCVYFILYHAKCVCDSVLFMCVMGGVVFAANVPGFGRLIDGIQRKKSTEQIIIAVVIGVLVCFTIWWVFLR